MYALWTPDIIIHAEVQRLFMPIFLHGHMLHLIINLLGTLQLGLNAELNWGIALNSNAEQGEGHAQRYERDLEGSFRWSTRNGSSKMLVVYVLSGLFGNISSAVADKIHMQTNPQPVLSVTVGASGSLCGLLGGELAFLWSTWPYAERRSIQLLRFVLLLL
jgi:membrane associated rhomboid family serine protease